MALKIEILVPAATQTYEVGVENVQNINVHFYFANVVHVVVYFTDGSRRNFYQIPCILYTPAPTL
ncbi:MAG: hypothetical protein Q7J06_01345 [Bacteroidales bacterium]|nr:hypothetical protein [Bacteroidales bacterium]